MKWQAVIVLVAIALTILVPPALPLMSVPGRHAQIGTLDVCHSALPAIAANGEMPCINLCQAAPCPTIVITRTACQKPFFMQSLITLDTEHPPKA